MTPQQNKPLSPKVQAILEKAKANHAATLLAKQQMEQAQAQNSNNPQKSSTDQKVQQNSGLSSGLSTSSVFTGTSFSPTVVGLQLSEEQLRAVELAMRTKSFCLIGAAGTGKTTTTREVIGQITRLSHISPLASSTKYLQAGDPGIVIIAFTNKAVNNIKKFLPEVLKRHCMTIHKLLEFMPLRSDDGQIIGFGPTRNQLQPLPHISCIIWEESSMIGTDHHKMVMDALPVGNIPQEIYLGDLNQLPPVFGPSILGFKLTELPVVELTKVHRQALNSPILTLAHRVREGKTVGGEISRLLKAGQTFIDDRGEDGKVTLRPWKQKISDAWACKRTGQLFCGMIDSGDYIPETDVILIPFNKSFGSVELNKYIADHLGKKRNADVYEIIARGDSVYFAVGDRVLYDRRECIIERIAPTPGYSGKYPQQHSPYLNRWGKIIQQDAEIQNESPSQENSNLQAATEQAAKPDIFDLLDEYVPSSGIQDEEAKNSASHTLTLRILDDDSQVTVSKSGDIKNMVFSYAITVHKSQGSEWRKVFFILHYSHNTMCTRELVYTALTRPRKELYVILDPGFGSATTYDSLSRAATNPEIKGVTLEEKTEYFKGKKGTYRNGN